MTNAALRGKPDAGNPHVAPSRCYGGTSRFDEGGVSLVATPRRGSLLYNRCAMISFAVAMAFGGALDIVESGVNGFLVPPDRADAQGFAEAIEKALSADFGDVRTPALEKFSFDRMVSRSLSVYDELAPAMRRL